MVCFRIFEILLSVVFVLFALFGGKEACHATLGITSFLLITQILHFVGDGSITKEEFSNAFTSKFNASADHASKVFSKVDKDGSGDISLEEISALFTLMDEDGLYEGNIFFYILSKLNFPLFKSIIKLSGSGDVSKEEFVEAWKKVSIKTCQLVHLVCSKSHSFRNYH